MAEHGRVVEDDHDARMGDGCEVGGAQEHGRSAPRGAEGQDDLLPRVPRAMREPPRRRHDRVAVRPERRQPRRELARPALDPAELGTRGGAGVDGDAVTGQQA